MIDYSLYLVTGRDLLPPGKDFHESLEEALQGGVTIVQVREKNTDTAEFLEIALKAKLICAKYGVPLIINDRVDIALAIEADGVHVGQTDMPVSLVRKLLPNATIVGVSCNNVQEVEKAVQDGADYIGIGAVWATTTKDLSKPLVGVRGVGAMLQLIDGTSVKAVAIGGIKSTNLLRTLHGTVSPSNHALDGVAVVSEIVASKHPRDAATNLIEILRAFKSGPSVQQGLSVSVGYNTQSIIDGVVGLMKRVKEINPLIHQITNNVVIAQSANITISLGASPIMATTSQEMQDLANICNALLVNIGTLVPSAYEGMLKAGYFVNTQRKPIVFDPVGVGATNFRKETVNELLNTWQASVIKGNAAELAVLAGSIEVQSKGVDTVGPGFSDPVSFVRVLAQKERCIVVLTGKTDYISDGRTVAALSNGHEFLGRITGSGCATGSCIATYCAAASALSPQGSNSYLNSNLGGKTVTGDMFLGAIGGVLVFTIAAELAAMRDDVKGPGTFYPALVDELASLTPDAIRHRAKVQLYP